MGSVLVPRNAGTAPGQIYVWETTLTAGAAGTDSHTSETAFNGLVWKVELDPGTLANNATIDIYDSGATLGTPEKFVDYTSASWAEKVIRPSVLQQTNAGADTTAVYEHYCVAGKLKADLASATEGNTLTIRVYILG